MIVARLVLGLSKEQRENPQQFGALANFRLRTLPVVGYMPAVFGMMAAGWVVSALGSTPIEPKRVEMISESFRRKLLRHLLQREKKVFGNTDKALICDECEVAYVAEDVWCMKSSFGDRRAVFKGLTMTRFDRSKPALPYVCTPPLLAAARPHWSPCRTRARAGR